MHLLGIVDYDAALLLQKHLVYEISGRNDRFGTVLICEHPPGISIGREGSRFDVAEERELITRQIGVRFVNRGGGALVHTPGQLAVYPILPLDRLAVSIGTFREKLANVAANAAREVQIPAFCAPDGSGVHCRCGQFAFVGATVQSWVSYHGLFLNVSPHPDLIRLTTPPGGGRVTSLAAQKLAPVSMHSVRESVARHVAAEFGYNRVNLHTGHPLLKRTRRKVHAHA